MMCFVDAYQFKNDWVKKIQQVNVFHGFDYFWTLWNRLNNILF